MAKSVNTARKNTLVVLIFLWLSFTLHLYFFTALAHSSYLQEFLNSLNKVKKEKPLKINNIILETEEESLPPTEEAAISDKNASDAAPLANRSQPRAYNFVGSRAASSGKKTEAQEKSVTETGRVQKEQTQAGSKQAPLLYDPDQKPIVNLYNTGDLSLATEAKDYAKYFLAMRDKIGKYHKEFFPVYQYYQGLLRDGVVVVDFAIDRNGNVSNVELVSSYGSDTVDKASLNSIIYSKNFGPLPEDLAKQGFVKIRFHFVYFSR